MFTPLARAILILISCLLIAYGFHTDHWITYWTLPVPVLFAVGYFRYGTVWLAFRAMRKGHIDRVRRLVAQIKWPSFLNSQHRAYLHWLKGSLALADGDATGACGLLQCALHGKLRTSNDRSLVACTLAELAVAKDDNASAREFLDLACSEPHRQQVDDIIAKLERAIIAGGTTTPPFDSAHGKQGSP